MTAVCNIDHGQPPVAHVTAFYPPSLGGVENVTRTLVEALAGYTDVQVLTTDRDRGDCPRHERIGRLHVHRERAFVVAHTPVSPGLVWRLLRLRRGTLVHAHLTQAFLPEVVWFATRLRGNRLVAHFHMEVDPSGPAGLLLRPYQRFVLGPVLRRADRVIALTERQVPFLVRRYGVDSRRVLVIPNGVPPDIKRPFAPKRRDVTSGVLRVVFVGRLDAQKNVGRLLDAVALLTVPVEVTVVGAGELGPALTERAAREKLHMVRFVGPQRGTALLAAYRSADIFVLTSDREGMPLVLLEAMTCGLPIVATDVEGVREAVGDAGLVVEPTAHAIASAVTTLATEHELYNDLAGRSYARGQRFQWSESVTRLLGLYRALS